MKNLDTRYKLLLLLAISIASFIAKDVVHGALVFACVCLITFSMGQSAITFKFIALYIMIAGLNYLAPYIPTVLASLLLALTLALRMFFPMMLYAKGFIETTPVSDLIAALHQLKVPRVLALAFIVALRFFPTARDEWANIRDALYLRGLELSIKNLVTRPTLMFEGLLMPIMMRAAVVSEELSASSISRGIDNPGARTHFRESRITARDTMFSLCFVGLIGCIIAMKYGAFGAVL